MLVLDASMTLAWLFDDEHSEPAEQVFERVADAGAVVPGLWWLEVANSMRNAVRRGRCDEAYVDRSLASLGELPIATDDETAKFAWNNTLALSRSEGLTMYDACYLELAIRRRLPLATGDTALAAAAMNKSVQVIAA